VSDTKGHGALLLDCFQPARNVHPRKQKLMLEPTPNCAQLLTETLRLVDAKNGDGLSTVKGELQRRRL